jgi:beta-galactosidase
MFDYFRLVFETYRALRRLGLSVDIISPHQATSRINDYPLTMMPGLFACPPELAEAVATATGRVIIGPRAASKTADFRIPAGLAPDLPEDLRPVTVTHVETLADGLEIAVGDGAFQVWRDFATPHPDAEVILSSADGRPALVRLGALDYLCGWPDKALFASILAQACAQTGVTTIPLPDGLRLRRAGNQAFVMNYSDTSFDLATLGSSPEILHGDSIVPPSGFAVIRL